MKRVSTKLSPKEAKSEYPSTTELAKGPEYPYGLRLTLDAEMLDKLGIKTLPAVDSTGEIEAVCKVVSTSSNASQGGKTRRSVELQIVELGFGPSDEKQGAAGKLYDKGEG